MFLPGCSPLATTSDLLITNQLLYQLSHTSTKQSYFFDRFVIILKKKLLVKAKLHFFNI